MADSHRVVVLDGARTYDRARTGSGKSKVKFPFQLPGEDRDRGLMRYRNGSLARVIKLEGISLFDLQCGKRRQKFGDMLKTIIGECRVDLKFLFCNWSKQSVKPDQLIDSPEPGTSLYLDWFSEYQTRWISKISAGRRFYQFEHYVIVSLPKEELADFADAGERLADFDSRFVRVRKLIASLDPCLDNRVLSRRELRALLYRQMYPLALDETEIAPPEYASTSSLPEPEAYEKARSGYMELGDSFFSQLSILELPETTSLGWLTEFMTSEFPFSMVVSLKALNQESFVKNLEGRRRGSGSKLVKAVLKSVTDGREGVVRMSCYLSTWAKDPESLGEQVAKLQGSSKKTGAVISKLMGRQLNAWRSCLALPGDFLENRFTVTSSVASDGWTAVADARGDSSGVWLGQGRSFKHPVFFDLFAKGGGNCLLVPKEGTKQVSWTLPLLILRMVIPYKVILLGRGEVFGTIHKILGAKLSKHVELGVSGKGMAINPCETGDSTGAVSEAKLKFLVNLLEMILGRTAIQEASLTYLDLESSIKRAYGRAGKLGRCPVMSELLNYLPARVEAARIKQAYIAFLGGKVGSMIDSGKDFEPGRNFSFLDLSDSLSRQERLILKTTFLEYAVRYKTSDYREKVVFALPQADELIGSGPGQEMLDTAVSELKETKKAFLLGLEKQLDLLGEDAGKCLLEAAGAVLFSSGKGSGLHLNLEENRFLQENSRSSLMQNAILYRNGFKSGLLLFSSPIEYCIVGETAKLLDDRNWMLERVKKEHPKFNREDTIRQAVYHHSMVLEP